jgi:MFS family permease
MAIDTTIRSSAAGVRWPRSTLGMLAAVNFMVILDSQIVILALPSIATEFAVTSAQAQWVMSAYLLAFGGLLLLGGRLGDRFGSRRVFMVGTALFGAAPCCAVSHGPSTCSSLPGRCTGSRPH